MKLISCHVDNFGKLQDFNYKFNDMVSIIHQDNGWGKSTLATFVRVMFFGFLGENKRNIIENERKRYKPWQMGTYGGSIVFSVNNNEYRMERTFGEKKSGSDNFVLYDNKKNIVSHDYSNNIGEELFDIDIESFMRTVFIAQQDCGTSVTPNISAKIGNVSDQTADMGNYDTVQNTLKREMDKITPDRATGMLRKMDMKIAELNEEIRNKDNYVNRINELEGKLREQIQIRETKQTEYKIVQNELTRLASIKDAQTDSEKYKDLCAQEEEAKSKYKKVRSFFPKEVPTKETINTLIARLEEYEDELQTCKNFSLTENENKKIYAYERGFKNGIPDDDSIVKVEKNIEKLSVIQSERDISILSDTERRKLDEARQKFSSYMPSLNEIDKQINDWSERKSKKEVLSTKIANAELIRNAKETTYNSNNMNGIIGIVLLIAAVLAIGVGLTISIVIGSALIGLICIGVGIITAVIGVIVMLKKHSESKEPINSDSYNQLCNEIERDKEFIDKAELSCKKLFERLGIDYNEYDVIAELNNIRNLIKDYNDLEERNSKMSSLCNEKDIKAIKNDIIAFFDRYNLKVSETDYQRAVFDLKTAISEYNRISEKKNILDAATTRKNGILNEIEQQIEALGFDVSKDIKGQLAEISEKQFSLHVSKEDLDNKKSRKEKFIKEHDISKLSINDTAEPMISMETLSEKFSELKDEIDSISELEDTFEEQIDDAYEKYNKILESEAELINLKENFRTINKRYQIISKTRDYLEKARENFSSKYMDDIKRSFEKYHGIISDGNEKYELDANLNILAVGKGGLHEVETLSNGYQDMVGLCRRIAMIDAMYDKEKPFLVMDDPFVNLDESRLTGAKRFLEMLAKKYQIVYFSCHVSRC